MKKIDAKIMNKWKSYELFGVSITEGFGLSFWELLLYNQ